MTKADQKAIALKKFNEELRVRRYAKKTVETYRDWIAQYVDYIAQPGRGDTRESRINGFLTRLVVEQNVSASTQKQALCAIIKFYLFVRKEKVEKLDFAYSSKQVRLPVVLSREECWSVLDQCVAVVWLWVAFFWGCGLRLEELCGLRVQDVDIDRRQVTVRRGKGNKDRIVPLPELLVEPLSSYLRRLRTEYERYAERRIPVWLPDALDRKYPAAPFAWEWFWLFPAMSPIQNKSSNPDFRTTTPMLYHIHHTAVQKRVGRAIRAARIPKKAGCHTLRHSFATHWLENAEGTHEVALLRLQQLLGHKELKTTAIYLHCVKIKTDVVSPLDVPLRRAA
jgi:integron integrase